MISNKRLQILITLMFVAMMFLQTPAIASNTAVLNTKSTDYQSGNQFSSGNTASTNSVSSTNTLNGNAQVSSVNTNYIAYNDTTTGTLVEMNSSYVHPGQYLNVSVNTSLINNFRYNNSLTYSIKSPIGQEPYNSTSYNMVNGTPVTNSPLTNVWSAPLNGQISYNSSSYSELYGVNISNVVATPDPLASANNFTEQITWNTVGYTNSEIKYCPATSCTANTLTNPTIKTNDGFTTTHTMYLTNLQNVTTYYFQIFGTDIFGRTINNTINYFTRSTVGAGVPIITSALNVAIGSTNATVLFQTNIGISNTLVYINLATSPAQVNNPLNQIVGTSLTGLNPGTRYFFKIELDNGSLKTVYDNGGHYYSFVTQQKAITLSSVQTSFNSTSSQESLTFSTDVATYASIVYSTNPDFSSVQSTTPDNLSTSHVITFNVTSATNYYYMINLTTSALANYTLIQTNSASSTSQTLFSNLETSYPGYFTFQTPVSANQDVHITYINLVFQLPTYPAVLGNWSIIFSVNQTNTIVNGLAPSYSLNTNFDAVFPIMFTLNDSLVFTPTKTYIQRGTVPYNGTSTYPIWTVVNNSGIYSPTDNLLFIGRFSYSTDPGQYINSSDWSSYETQTTGLVNQYFNGNLVGANSTAISSISNVYNSVGNTAGVKINSSLLTNLDPNIDNFVNVQIPAKDIYGNLTIEVGLNMPHSSSAPAYRQYSFSNTSLTLKVKYRLLVTEATGGHDFSLTQSNLVGSATIIPLHWINIEQAYSGSNVTNFIDMPGSAIHLNLSVMLNGKQQNIFKFTNANYTWYWYREVIDSSLSTGNYSVKLLWTGLDGSPRGIVTESNTAYTSQKEFSTWFVLSVSYTVQDLTANLTVLPQQNVTLRFKVVVPATGVAWDRNMNLTTKYGNCVFDPVTGEYKVNLEAPSTPQIVTVTVSGATLQNDTLSFTVSKSLPTIVHTGQPVITYSQVNKHVSLIGYGFIVMALVGTVVYAGIILYFVRRR